ncbi:hypothetical protein EV648_107246 [Kribbella sp. VKM Ac-2568]|nr:hypothetical protein EV648_107246 [Kribbella sp. VKM Ac-2568]
MELFQKTLATDCYSSIAEQAAGKKSQDLYSVDAEQMLQLLEKDGEIPVRRHAEPIFLAQGTADTVVFGPAMTVTADQLRAVGNDLPFKVCPGVDHNGLLAAPRSRSSPGQPTGCAEPTTPQYGGRHLRGDARRSLSGRRDFTCGQSPRFFGRNGWSRGRRPVAQRSADSQWWPRGPLKLLR